MFSSPHRGAIGRRGFLAQTAAAGVTVVGSTAAFGSHQLDCSPGDDRLRRPRHLDCRSVRPDGEVPVRRLADYFPDRAQAFGDRFKIPSASRYTTLSAYKRLLDSSVDAVVIESPPYFHPEQAAAAVDAGKHVYLAKPMAVDVPGCMTIAEAGKKATAKGLVYLIDFQTRADDTYIETLRRVHRGDIGQIVSAVATYPWGGTVHDDRLASTPEERIRLWYQTRAFPAT